MKAKFKIEKFEPRTEFVEGRVFFGQKGTIQTVWIAGYMPPVVELIKKMGVKHIDWRIPNQEIPDALLTFVKSKRLTEMDRVRKQYLKGVMADASPVENTTGGEMSEEDKVMVNNARFKSLFATLRGEDVSVMQQEVVDVDDEAIAKPIKGD